MQGWKVLVAILAGALLFFVVAALIMPSQYLAAKPYVMRAKPETIFPYLVDLQTWPEWTIWNTAEDGSMKIRIDGPDRAVGAVLAWEGKRFGSVRREVTSIDAPREINFSLQLKPGLPPARERITLEPIPASEGGGTRVIWGALGDVGGDLLARLKIGVMQRSAAQDFHTNLWRLAYRVELKSGALKQLPDGGVEQMPWPADGGVAEPDTDASDAGRPDAATPSDLTPQVQP